MAAADNAGLFRRRERLLQRSAEHLSGACTNGSCVKLNRFALADAESPQDAASRARTLRWLPALSEAAGPRYRRSTCAPGGASGVGFQLYEHGARSDAIAGGHMHRL